MKTLQHQFLPLASEILLMILMSAGIQAAQSTSQNVVALKGRWLTGYKSLCDIEPKQSPETAIIQPGAGWVFSSGCEDLDKKRLVPLIVTFTNRDVAKSVNFTVPLLSDVTQRAAQGSKRAAALYIPWGDSPGFSTRVFGKIDVELAPGASAELLYLVPTSTHKAAISIKGYGALKILSQ